MPQNQKLPTSAKLSIFDISANPDGSGSAGAFPYTAGDVGHSKGGFGHPTCLNPPTLSSLPAVQ
jgi:hypothetical protein